jgi:hypothetical protein
MSISSAKYSVAKRKRRDRNIARCKFFPSSGNMHINEIMSSKIWRTALSKEIGRLRHIVIRH